MRTGSFSAKPSNRKVFPYAGNKINENIKLTDNKLDSEEQAYKRKNTLKGDMYKYC